MRGVRILAAVCFLLAQGCDSKSKLAVGMAGVDGGAAGSSTGASIAKLPAKGEADSGTMADAGASDSVHPTTNKSTSCGLHSGYPGDENCLVPPPPDKGFQLHLGPSDYKNPEPQYVLKAGEETTVDLPAVSSNDKDVYFYYRQYGMRTGAHHMIVTTGTGGVNGQGRRIATANHSEEYPVGGKIAPENVGVGIPLGPKATINVQLHSINLTNQPQVREIWINFWYRDAKDVTEPVEQLFQIGDPLLAVQPGEDKILGPYTCNIRQPGRMLWFYGHRHANNVRFSAWRVRGGKRELFYEAYHFEEPKLLDYSSNVTNNPPDPVKLIDGGWSGILDMMPGDQLQWECHVINMTDGILHFTNNTYTGEMCIMDGELVGTNCGP